MRELDLSVLAKALQGAPPHTPEPRTVEASDLDVYLFEALYPMLLKGSVRLDDVEYDQFEADDLRVLAYYIEEDGRRSYPMESLNGNICRIAPACTTRRAFL